MRDPLINTLRNPIKRINWKARYTHRHLKTLCALSQSLRVHMSCAHTDLEGFAFSVSSIPSGSFILSTSSFMGPSFTASWVFQHGSLSVMFPMDLCTSSHLWQEQTSPMGPEQSADLLPWPEITKVILYTIFLMS